MIKLRNHRPVRLIDSKGRFDLRPGEVVSFTTLPDDLQGLVDKGYLLKVKAERSARLLPKNEDGQEIPTKVGADDKEPNPQNREPSPKQKKKGRN